MAGTRPSAGLRNESPHSSPWWETGEFSSIQKSAQELRSRGDWEGLEEVCLRGHRIASEQGNVALQATYLTAIGNARLMRYKYSAAIDAWVHAKTLAESAADWTQAGAIALNLASLYERVWDHTSAVTAAEEGRVALDRLEGREVPYRTELLLALGRLYANDGDRRATLMLERAVATAQKGRDRKLEAAALGSSGEWSAVSGKLAEAQRSFEQAYALRKQFASEDLPFSERQLGWLDLALGDHAQEPERTSVWRRAAERLAAVADARAGKFPATFTYLADHDLGRALERLGQHTEALARYRKAVEGAVRWRGFVVPSTSALTGSNVELDRRIFDSFVEASARRYFATADAGALRESFLASETSRASSLRDTQALGRIWRDRLPPEYWKLLAALRTTDAAAQARTKLRITEMEALAAAGFPLAQPENFLNIESLTHFRKGLSREELFLSFHLGGSESVLWAVTADGIRAYRLESAAALEKRAAAFRKAVLDDDPKTAELGQDLYHSLFGGLAKNERAKHAWLLSVEGFLFETPLAALVPTTGKFLIEEHSLQLVPSALALAAASLPRPATGVLVGDPIYNSADRRLDHRVPFASGQLNRLPASGFEIAASGQELGEAERLEGPLALRGHFLDALDRHPALIHLATHVLSSSTNAWITFGLGGDGRPETLTTAEVAALDVAGAFVVMTGCASGTGEIADGAGLQGLTRAWMAAGATQVLETLWAMPDRPSNLMPEFYRNWTKASPPEALRRSQVQMLTSGTWQAAPSHWAAFRVSGGVH